MELAEYCAQLAGVCGEAGQWVERNGEVVRNEKEGLLRDLRRSGRLFRRCARAAGRKMCAGVFGPSQAGKSYLISALARDADNSLNALFGPETRDFISEINPEGGKESTGLVTRFTMTRPENLPEGHPVHIRLLSETDIVKILANTYYADCEHKEEPQSDIEATMKILAKRGQSGAGGIDLDALEDLREYLAKNFKSKARVAELERSFWEEALLLGPKLGLEDRILLYSLIWDEVPEFTELLRRLLKALEGLGHPEEAFCTLDALVPREKSIIDVATLAGLEGDGQEEDLELVTPRGRHARLPRAVVTALTAELTIVMDRQPAPYFEHTDLLDFPGYRSRYKFDDVRREVKKAGMLKEMFLRGKVAYLFERYCAERELTSMLLCIGPSNQEVQDLPGVINEWIASTHGGDPEDRKNKAVSLFLVLTKFDVEFEQKKGAPSVETRWDNRLHASLLDFFGKSYDWPREWVPGQAFNNIFLLRNPNYRFDSVLEYDGGGHEKGVRPEMQGYVAQLETAFMKSPLVAAHFKDTRKAWDAAMMLDDGGISYIRESLSPLCDPAIKRSQLLQSVDAAREALMRRLRAFYQTDDMEEAREEKRRLCRQLSRCLYELETKRHTLGQLLHSLVIPDTDIADLHPEAHRRFLELRDSEEAVAPEVFDAGSGEGDGEEWNLFDQEPEAVPAAAEKTVSRDEASFFAAYIESRWVDRLHELADNPTMQKYYMLPGRHFTALVSELSTGAARLGLRDEMAEKFRKVAAYGNQKQDDIVTKQARIAAHTLNSYVDWLGYNPRIKTEAERRIQTGPSTSAVVFEPPAPVGDFPRLGEKRSDYTRNWFRDWLNAFYGLAMANVNFDGDREINVEENMALGSLLKRLEANA